MQSRASSSSDAVKNNEINRNLNFRKSSKSNREKTESEKTTRNNPNFLDQIEKAKQAAGINRGNAVSKHALYAAAISNEVSKKSEKLGAHYLERLKENMIVSKQVNREAIKPAAHNALNDLVREGSLTADEVRKITHNAWKLVFRDLPRSEKQAAALEGPTKNQPASARPVQASKSPSQSELSDARGVVSRSAPRTQSASHSAAGSAPRSGSISSHADGVGNTQTIDAPRGFLWKPEAENSVGLVVLLPSEWTGNIASFELIDPNTGKTLGDWEDAGVGNGKRQHFRFRGQPGSSFPDGTIVRVQLKDGSVKEIAVAETSARTEGR